MSQTLHQISRTFQLTDRTDARRSRPCAPNLAFSEEKRQGSAGAHAGADGKAAERWEWRGNVDQMQMARHGMKNVTVKIA
jgi:hypothetical protein